MAGIGTTLTLLDWAKRIDPDGKIAALAEILNKDNMILDDAMWIEGNLPTGHRHSIRTSLPAPTWRRVNSGVADTKSTSRQEDNQCGMLETYAEVDKALADLNGNTAEFRMSEDVAHIEGMNQEFASTLFYGNQDSDPEEFTGLAPRYGAISTTTTDMGYNVISAGGTESVNTSLWLITWAPEAAFCIFPKGSKAGLEMEDLGQVTLLDSNSNKYEGYRSHYTWKPGLAIKDWRYCGRVCNIPTTTGMDISPALGSDIITYAIKLLHRLPAMKKGRMVWYCNSTVAEFLQHQARNNLNVNLTINDVAGEPMTMLQGFPIKRCDAILNTESTIS